MLTFGLSLASPDEPGAAEPDPSAFAVSRGAGGGRGGLMVGAAGLVARGLCMVDADFAFGRAAGRRVPGVVRADSLRNMDVRRAVGRFRRPRGLRRVGEFPARWPAHPGRRRSAELVAPGGERGPPDSARGGKALEDPSASRIDDEALITPWAGAHVGEIDSWPAHERRCQRIALRIETPFDLARRPREPPRRRLPLGRRGESESDRAERQARQTKEAQRSNQSHSHAS